MIFERFLPPDPNHRTEAVVGLARALAENPHDSLLHSVMADALGDAGNGGAEVVAHRIAAHPDRVHDLVGGIPDDYLHAAGVHLSRLAHAVSQHAATATAKIPQHVQYGTPHDAAITRAEAVAGESEDARNVAAEPGRASGAESRHSITGSRHESLANYHEARSYEPNGSAGRWKFIRDGHEAAGAAHRAAESFHHAASAVQREIDTRSWRASRGVE